MIALFGIDILGQILCILQGIANMFLWAIVTALNAIILAVSVAIAYAVSFLPAMPDDVEWTGVVADVFGYANWVFPVGYIVTALGIILALWIVWAVFSILLRWGKAV